MKAIKKKRREMEKVSGIKEEIKRKNTRKLLYREREKMILKDQDR